MTTDNFCFICKTDYSKPVKQEVNGTVILPTLVFPDERVAYRVRSTFAARRSDPTGRF
jgi:hypothetical protein